MHITSPLLRRTAVAALLAVTAILLSPVPAVRPAEAAEALQTVFALPAGDAMFAVGEELVYNVSYSIFDIGSIKLQVLDTGSIGGVRVYKMKTFADSYSGLPFVDLHLVFYSEMNDEASSLFFITHNTAKTDVKPFTRYRFDYRKMSVRYDIGTDPGGKVSASGDVAVAAPQLDGLSLFYYARKNFRQKAKVTVPVFANEKSHTTFFNFMDQTGSTEIDAVTYPVETVEFDGTLDFIGVFGLTGYFRGFFSNDAAGIPIVAKMKVILGSVHIELTKWSRPGWTPPRYKD